MIIKLYFYLKRHAVIIFLYFCYVHTQLSVRYDVAGEYVAVVASYEVGFRVGAGGGACQQD